MNQNIINKYQIRFENKVFDFETGKEIHKSISTNNGELTTFLNDWTAPKINELLLPDFEEAMANPETEVENGSETISISIYADKVDFYDNDFNYVGNIPTQEFKEIVIGWRDFLNTPPLNGTKMS
ncbi:hypothetical protein [Empedobacter falsenii]|uniref:hypothetical protein n=1 Tax=Empedobacter falsenii TaxID=343874 RepID=UPI0005714DE3|nr:hypothetical protein [Empedobacter falsenii]